MSALTAVLDQPDDNRPVVEIALDLLSEHDRDAITEAMMGPYHTSKTIHTAFDSDGAVRDAGATPSVAAIDGYRRRKGWK